MEIDKKAQEKVQEQIACTSIYPDNRPSALEYVVMSQEAYQTLKRRAPLPGFPDWKVEETKYHHDSQYYGVLYINKKTRALVLAHRGTANLWTLATEDMTGIFNNANSPQKREAFIFVEEVLKIKEDLEKEEGVTYQLSFTGHSLGAFLAELCVFKLRKEKDLYTHSVSFDSPGSKQSMIEWQPHIENRKIVLESLDITTYLSYPNIVNSCNEHVGTVYTLQPNLKKDSWKEQFFYLGNKTGIYTSRSHSIEGLGLALKKLVENQQSAIYVKDWPWGLKQYNQEFFKHAEYKQDSESGYYEIKVPESQQKEFEQRFELLYKTHYELDIAYDTNKQLELNHVQPELKKLLQEFHQHRKKMDEEAKKQFKQLCHQHQVNASLQTYLLEYELNESFLIAKDVIQFRQLFSTWLSENFKTMIALMNFKPVYQQNTGLNFDQTFLKGEQKHALHLEGNTQKGQTVDLNLDADTPEERAYKLEVLRQFGSGYSQKQTFIESTLPPGSTIKGNQQIGGQFSMFAPKQKQENYKPNDSKNDTG